MKKILLFLSASLLTASWSFAQNKIDQSLQILSDSFPQEKLILNLSKSEYVAGENIFFKAYTLNGYTPVAYSTNLYVELYDQEKNLVDTALFPIYKGTAAGSVALSPKLPEGVYYLRAYTRWMLNFDETFNYVKTLKIYNPTSEQKLIKKPVKLSANVFPESGHLRPGVLSKVVVRLDGNNTLPDSFKATLYEKGSAQPIASTESLNSQLAVLQFMPRVGHTYFVTVTDKNGNAAKADLPTPRNDAVVLQAFNLGEEIKYMVHFGSENQSGAGYKILGTIHDKPVFRADVKNSAGSIVNSIKTKDLPNGVLMITVFDEKENAVAQRLTFINPTKITTAEPLISTDTLDFAWKARNSWQIEPDSTLWYSYSAEVQDANAPAPENFLSQVFLSSDFPSAIADPSWYFENINASKADGLDALLITENWRRFNWKDLLAGNFPKTSPVSESYLTFVGTVKRRNKIAPNQDINLIMKDSKGFVQITNTVTDSSGRIYMNEIFTDTLKVAYQLNEKNSASKNVNIDFKSVHHFSPLDRTATFSQLRYGAQRSR
ncbi:MAG: hypothetical protein ACO1OO_13975 [Flavisolibacter sp.]